MKTEPRDIDMVETCCKDLPEEPKINKNIALEIIEELKTLASKGPPKWLTKKEALTQMMGGRP